MLFMFKCLDDVIEALTNKVTIDGDRDALIVLLRDHKYDIYQELEDGKTLLHMACQEGHTDIINALIEVYGCTLDVMDDSGNTPCHVACLYGQFEVMAYFENSSRELNSSILNYSGQSWLHFVCQSSSIPLIRLITYISLHDHRKLTLVKLNLFEDDILLHLFSQNKCIKFDNNFEWFFCTDNKGFTPLHVACLENNLSIVKLFVSEIQLVLNFNFLRYIPSVLALACRLNHFQIVDYLLQHQTKPTVAFCVETERKIGIFTFENTRSEEQSELPIFFAARLADQELFNHLSQKHQPLEFTNEMGETILHAACVSGSIDMFKMIYHHVLEKSLKHELVCNKDKLGNTCMHTATKWGSLETVRFLFEKNLDINDQNNEGNSPLHLAIKYKRKNIFDFLLKSSVKVNSANNRGETPMHIATCNSSDVYFVKHLIGIINSDSLKAKDIFGDTPLFNACRTKNMDMINLLVSSCNCDVLAINEKKKETVANIACRLRCFDFLQIILKGPQQYPSKLQNYLGQTLIHLACWNDDLEMATYLAEPHNSYKLSEDINLLDKINELTPLQFACIKNDFSLFSYLINLPECYPDMKNKQGDTALHICCRMNLKKMVQQCAEICSKLVRNELGNTPLHVACQEKNYELLETFISSFPGTNRLDGYVNKEGNSVLHVVAGQEGTLNILKMMVPSRTWDHNKKNKDHNTPLHLAFKNGILENSIYLLGLQYEKNSWYNKQGDSPLALAITSEAFNFIHSMLKHCPDKMTTCCAKKLSPDRLYYPDSLEVVEIPWMLYLLQHLTVYDVVEERFRYYPNNERKKIDQKAKNCIDFAFDYIIHSQSSVTQQVDSHNNNLLHYLAMCSYDIKLEKLAQKCMESMSVNNANDGQCTPLHYACTKLKEWVIFNILEKHSDGKKINKKNSRGETPLSLAHKFISSSKIHYLEEKDILYYLTAHGATIENGELESSLKLDFVNSEVSIGIIVLGNSGVGKTTLINTLRMMLTDNRNDLERVTEPTTGLKITDYSYYKNSHCYRFYDFAGQIEFEATHSVYLENLLTPVGNSKKNPFIFLLMVKANDSLEQNKRQIDRWVFFLRGHTQINSTSVHLALVCSHEDLFATNQSKSERLLALKKHFEICDATPLDKHELPFSLNNTKPDSASVCQLMEYLEDMFISCEPLPVSQAVCELNHYLQLWFKDQPYQIKDLIDKIKQTRQFVFNEGKILYKSINSSRIIIPHEKNSLIEYLQVLNIRNDILLLMQPEDDLDWWIVSKNIQNTMFSKANSLFSPDHFEDSPHHSLITFNTGVVPMKKLQEIFSNLGFDFNIMIDYLLCLEFCTEISEETFNAIVKGNHEKDVSYSDKLYFFPGLIRKEKEIKLFHQKKGSFCTSGWLIENKHTWNAKFVHCLLLHLTYKLSVKKDELHFARRIHLWKQGLFICTQNQVEVLVEVKSDTTIYIICRGQSQTSLAKYRAEIFAEIRSLQESMIRRGTSDFSDCYSFVLYPSPLDYDSINECCKIYLNELTKLLHKDKEEQSHYISDTEVVSLKDLFIFDPCMYINNSLRNLLLDDNKDININSVPPELLEISELKSMISSAPVPISQFKAILAKYSIFSESELFELSVTTMKT